MPKSAEFFLRLIQRATAFRSLPQDHVYRYLTRSTGSIDMNVDGSGAAINFDYIVPAGTDYDMFSLSRLNIVLVDGSMRWDQFGGLGSALANGLLLQLLDDGGTVQQHFDTDRQPVQDNADFGGLAGVDNPLTAAAGPDAMPVRFTVERSGNKPTLFPNWIVRAVVQDNLAGLTKFRIQVQGVLRRKRAAQIS